MEIQNLLIFFGGALLCVPCGFLLLEVVAGIRSRNRPHDIPAVRVPNAVLLIPAHNEQPVLGKMLRHLAKVNENGVRTIVIADNCSDDTVAIAREAGVEVWERSDTTRRGKPFALAWAINRLEEKPPDVVVILDADSWFEKGNPSELASQALVTNRPVQAIYRMADPGLRSFAFRFRNEIRLRGLAALGAPVQLTGSGFALPWELLQACPMAVGELAEDSCWGWILTCAGFGPQLAVNVEVFSNLPSSREGIHTQLNRWEHGILSATMRRLPALLHSAFFPPRLSRILHLFDVLVLPLALLGLFCLTLLSVGFFLNSLPLIVPALTALIFLASAVFLGWWAYGRADVSFRRLLSTPFYAIGKIGVYFSFLFRRQQGWEKTKRDDSESN
jgi:cellulose synthase/poly-beta-1,6-N-acetylglucosamine synthase-like glycosyltransferase